MKKTKIICTIGPATESREMLLELMKKGMDVARINMSHATYDQARNIIFTIRELNKELNKNVGILIDTKGPELFLKTYQAKDIVVNIGDYITLTTKENPDSERSLAVNYPEFIQDVKKEDKIFIHDGEMELRIVDETSCDAVCEVINGGIIKNNMGFNVPDVNINIDFLSIVDKNDIAFASSIEADYVALSFVRNTNDVLDVNDLLISLRNEHIQIISKIENKRAIADLDNIIKVSDGIMIARGDLGVEFSFAEVPYLQKQIVTKSLEANKICIVATQMLATMEHNSTPTRAEVSDVANAVVEGVDAVMLSDETAVGIYPIEALETMNKIIQNMEANLDYNKYDECINESKDITTIIAQSVVSSANKLKSAAIIASSRSGYTARKISNYRPSCPIIVTTPSEQTARSLSINYGTISVVTPVFDSTDEIISNSLNEASKILDIKDSSVIVTGSFPNNTNDTNFMKIEYIK